MDSLKLVYDALLNSPHYKDTTLLVQAEDESGGFYDHVSPPPTSEYDGVPYGTRIPVFFLGNLVKKNYISHTVLEHSSIVKFIEWNWLSGETG